MKNLKIAFTGASGSGKTTLVKWVSDEFNIPHISGSAGDVKTEADNHLLDDLFRLSGDGHKSVIVNSATHPEYAVINQKLLLMRRTEIIRNNDHFVTDRSPVDNMTYFINQCGYHPQVTTRMCGEFLHDCARAFAELDLVVYVKAVQPDNWIEDNGSRIANQFYQQAIDAQFSHWLSVMSRLAYNWEMDGPKVEVIDYWDLDMRKDKLMTVINHLV